MKAQTFGYRLRKARERAGLTQAQSANLLEVTRDTVASWESGRNEPIALAQRAALQLLADTNKEK